MFLDEMSKKEVKHESNISLMNQLFDGKGDKATLAKGNECHVIDNASCITVAVQPQPFCKALANMKCTLWLENGFRRALSLYICETIQVRKYFIMKWHTYF